MRRLIAVIAFASCALGVLGCRLPEPFRVMSFNIRYGTADDGENRWERRSDLVMRVIREYNPDILGMQEVLKFQADELHAALDGYEFVGVGRDDGREKGEFSPIMFRRDVFKLVDHGFLWLSEEPEHAGSLGWDAALPRLLTWVRLQHRDNPFVEIFAINTHFDHRGQKAREESASLVRRTVESLGGKPVIVMGDFNSSPDSLAHERLTKSTGNLAELHDCWQWLRNSEEAAGSFTGFKEPSTSPRIDWILVNRRFQPLETEIVRTKYDGRLPSDHYPVTATLKLLPMTDTGSL